MRASTARLLFLSASLMSLGPALPPVRAALPEPPTLSEALMQGPVERDGGTYYEINYTGSNRPGELIYDSKFTLWLPAGVKDLRGVIVHVHGCGINPSRFGHMAAYDLHWQTLARKWDCALLAPSFIMTKPDDICGKWCDPRNGSDKVFLQALIDLASRSHHAELARVPWILWGHSGGGNWISIMQMLHPERIAALYFRSGSSYLAWSQGNLPKVEIPDAALEIPMMCNVGAKERGDPKYNGGWENPYTMFKAYRAKGAPIGFAPDPLTVHACGDSRYLAIPFFDACLALRLPERGTDPTRLKKLDRARSWIGTALGHDAVPADQFTGQIADSVWLPNAEVARVWQEFVQTGEPTDTTPPPAPVQVRAQASADAKAVIVTWQAEIDFESGLQQFIIERDGREIGRVPEKLSTRNGRGLYQSMSSWDTPEQMAPEMKFTDQTAGASAAAHYHVIAVNSAGLRSR